MKNMKVQSRAKCVLLPSLPAPSPCVKMSEIKVGHGQFQETAQMPRALTGSLDRAKARRSQQTPSIGGYVTVPGEPTWSQNIDSAASMFPQTPRWEEEFQDLSSYCQTQEQNMSSGKEIDTKSSSCIVPDDELNTPEVCIPEFDFTRRNVLSRAETSPVSLFGGETWGFTNNNEKIGDGATPEVKPILSSEITSDQLSIPSVVNEEEINTSHETVIMLENTVNQEMDINMMSQDDVIIFVNQTNSEVIGDTSNEQNVEASLRYLESITQVPSQNTLPADNSFNSSVTDQIKIEMDNYMETESEELVQGNTLDAVVETVPTAARKSLKQKSNLSLNLAGLFTIDDVISTPVLLETVLQSEEEAAVCVDNLLDYVSTHYSYSSLSRECCIVLLCVTIVEVTDRKLDGYVYYGCYSNRSK
ncbi:hypothetical protein C0J52_02825 [Blattella germanica]|nr:hypothetical protein C0J52_02825 [Blattella germanica]